MSDLSWWWPTPQRLHEVLLGDAEAHSKAVALAVHQRMHIRRRHHDEPIDTAQSESIDEGAILTQLQEPVGDGCQVVLIEGKSGTGKSHVVRWIEIQLDRLPDRSSRVVLLVGKGSRLTDIVKHLSERPELAGPKHAALREQLSRAQQPIEPKDAASRLCNQLAFVCGERARIAAQKRQQGEALTHLEELYTKWGVPAQLPHLLVYNPLRPCFVEKDRPMRRLVEHLHARADPLQPRTGQEFVDADLTFEDLPDDLDERARRLFGRLEDPEQRSAAVRVLNDALDEAKRILLQLDPGVVQEVLKSIRRELLEQGKELVLLVEDFADLSGLQGEVLQASIQTGAPSGVKTYCTLRTVFAFTDSLLREQTVLSRAQHVYYVPNQIGENQVVEHSVRLVGSYLRAARFGAEALEKAAQESSSAESWLPAAPELGEEARLLLDAFGAWEGIPLFPFTRRVIDRLVRDIYAGQQTLLFVPRDIIRDLMPRVLNHREAFLQGAFPPDVFRPSREAPMADEARRWLMRQTLPGAARKRLERFLLYWGLNLGAARAFGLPEPDATESTPPPEAELGARASGEADETDGDTDPNRREPRPAFALFADDRRRFEGWRAGIDIAAQDDRRNIRRAIDNCLRPALGWAWRPRIDRSAAVSGRWRGWDEGIDVAGLRLAQGMPVLTLVRSEEREDKLGNEALAKELVSVCGPAGMPSPKTWDVEGIEMHLAAHLAFIERHRPAVEQHLLGLWNLRRWDALPFFVSALATTGAILGVQNCGSSVPEEFFYALFADPPEAAPNDSSWCREISTPLRPLRALLRDMLEREIGAFQGHGQTIHGIDVARLLPFVPAPRCEPAAPPAVPTFPPGAKSDADIQAVVDTAAILDRIETASIAELVDRKALAERVRTHVGSRAEKDGLVTALATLLRQLTNLGTVTTDSVEHMKAAISALKKAALVDPLESTAALVSDDASLWQRLVSLGRNESDIGRLANTARILSKVDAFLGEHERRLHDAATIDPLDEALAAHQTQLAEARTRLGGPASTDEAGEVR